MTKWWICEAVEGNLAQGMRQLNGVYTQMVSDTVDWPWSSYVAMTGLRECSASLQTDWILGQFGDDRSEAVARDVKKSFVVFSS